MIKGVCCVNAVEDSIMKVINHIFTKTKNKATPFYVSSLIKWKAGVWLHGIRSWRLLEKLLGGSCWGNRPQPGNRFNCPLKALHQAADLG